MKIVSDRWILQVLKQFKKPRGAWTQMLLGETNKKTRQKDLEDQQNIGWKIDKQKKNRFLILATSYQQSNTLKY